MTVENSSLVLLDCIELLTKDFAKTLDEQKIIANSAMKKAVIDKFIECLKQMMCCAFHLHAFSSKNVDGHSETVDEIEEELANYASMKPKQGISHDVIMSSFVRRIQSAQNTKKGTK